MAERFRPAREITRFDGDAPDSAEQREVADMSARMMAPLVGTSRPVGLVASALASVLVQTLACLPPDVRRIVWRDIKTAVDSDVEPRRPDGRLS